MGKVSRITYLTRDEIIFINQEVLTQTGGKQATGFILNEGSFDYLVEAPKMILFQKELYQTLLEKAAIYAFNIINNHIFLDGNKRTGLLSAFTFLQRNGILFSPEVTDDHIVDLGFGLASGEYGYDYLIRWLKDYTIIDE